MTRLSRAASTISTEITWVSLTPRTLTKFPRDRESAFIACSFWMVQNLVGAKRWSDVEKLFEKLVSLQNDVGLLSEEYDPGHARFMGNFPQALSHIALVNAARMLASRHG